MLQNNVVIADYEFIRTVPVTNNLIADAVLYSAPHYIFTSKNAVELFAAALKEHEIAIPDNSIVYCSQGETMKTADKHTQQNVVEKAVQILSTKRQLQMSK